MTLQPHRLVKTRLIKKLLHFFLGYLWIASDTISAQGQDLPPMRWGPGAEFKLISRISAPLSIYLLPIQSATVNNNFYFNVSSYLSQGVPEYVYLLTAKRLSYIALVDFWLAKGVTRRYGTRGDAYCSAPVFLRNGDSCQLALLVDVKQYISGGGLPWDWLNYETASFHTMITQLLPKIVVTPNVLDGLYYDAQSSSIVGKPTRSGRYIFSVTAYNSESNAQAQNLIIDVKIDPKDKPIFKPNPTIPAAIPNQDYQLNLMELLKPMPSFMQSNQLSFSINNNYPHSDWLSIDPNNARILHGHVPPSEAGQQKDLTITASSNTGGDSLPLTITIPVTYDSSKKPHINESLVLTGIAGEEFEANLYNHISPALDENSTKLIIKKIEPEAPWLMVSLFNPLGLSGLIPKAAVGREYKITLYASSVIGGDSEAVIIPLKIAMDKNLRPRFFSANPSLPLCYAGQACSHDFVANNDIYPEYKDNPYEIELAVGYPNPYWVDIENNILKVVEVPRGVQAIEKIYVRVKNVAGGQSEVIPLELFIQ